MENLRAIFSSMGVTSVTTYIRSGNVVFDSDHAVTALDVERELARHFDFAIPVMVRSAAQLRRVRDTNPFPDVAPTTLFVGFLASRPDRRALDGLDHDVAAPERWALVGSELFLHLPSGFADATLVKLLGRQLTLPVTYRNWNTFSKLVELSTARSDDLTSS